MHQKGVLAGYPVVGLKATLYDGSYHPVDSSEMSFKMAAAIAYKTGFRTHHQPCLSLTVNSKLLFPIVIWVTSWVK